MNGRNGYGKENRRSYLALEENKPYSRIKSIDSRRNPTTGGRWVYFQNQNTHLPILCHGKVISEQG
jgi:hypothetical protein